ncbi:MAG: hypothetical protein LWW97_10705 [Deltaproteobacteria bacterium]|nr:hypothetical protein [Deltaproteobacteria bacterium]
MNQMELPNKFKEEKHIKTLHLTPEAGAFFAFAISEQNFTFAKFSLASGAGELYVGHQSNSG